ncbi:MAG TPA: winged helix-turn-helix domain-containing protein [Nitrososphaeraceae archaeon]
MLKYRSRTEITNMMLDSARGGATKTKIMYKAYLSYSQLVEYLTYLKQNQLIALIEGTELYRPTEKGLKFLNMSVELSEMVTVLNSEKHRIEI